MQGNIVLHIGMLVWPLSEKDLNVWNHGVDNRNKVPHLNLASCQFPVARLEANVSIVDASM